MFIYKYIEDMCIYRIVMKDILHVKYNMYSINIYNFKKQKKLHSTYML